MIKYFFLMSFLFFLESSVCAFDHSHELWTQTLKKYRASDGMVKYSNLKGDASTQGHSFSTYLANLERVDSKAYSSWTKADKMAFLINAYNAFTVKLIIDHYPLASITDIGGWLWQVNKKPWTMEFFSLLEGKIKSLDPIEHEYLRGDAFQDYRIHAALNCASISCPLLRFEAYEGQKIDRQLDEQMALWLADTTRTQFDLAGKRVFLSKIFAWYQEDFRKWGGGVLNVVKKYGPEKARPLLTSSVDILYLDYNWDLNDAKKG